jgi:hypothetical protein
VKKSNLLLPLLFVLLNVANANPAENPNTCINSPDETGCLLNISKIKALKIKFLGTVFVKRQKTLIL